MKTVLNAAVTAALAVLVSQSAVAADVVSPTSLAVQYSAPTLGTSTNPAPASTGGLAATPSNMPSGIQVGPNGTVMTYSPAQQLQTTQLQQTMTAPPAWAQTEFRTATSIRLQPFASNLFEGRFASTFSDTASNDYVLAPGDRIVIRVWGVRAYDDVLVVDQQGNIFIPEVGPQRHGFQRLRARAGRPHRDPRMGRSRLRRRSGCRPAGKHLHSGSGPRSRGRTHEQPAPLDGSRCHFPRLYEQRSCLRQSAERTACCRLRNGLREPSGPLCGRLG